MTAHAAIKNTFFEDFFVQKSLTIIAFLSMFFTFQGSLIIRNFDSDEMILQINSTDVIDEKIIVFYFMHAVCSSKL